MGNFRTINKMVLAISSLVFVVSNIYIFLTLMPIYSCTVASNNQADGKNIKCSDSWLQQREVLIKRGSRILVVDSIVLTTSAIIFIADLVHNSSAIKLKPKN